MLNNTPLWVTVKTNKCPIFFYELSNDCFGVLRRVKEFLDLDTRCLWYTSLVLPLFDYGDTIWGDKNNSILMNLLQVLENKAAKIILDQHPRSSSTKALEDLKWTFIYKCMHA